MLLKSLIISSLIISYFGAISFLVWGHESAYFCFKLSCVGNSCWILSLLIMWRERNASGNE